MSRRGGTTERWVCWKLESLNSPQEDHSLWLSGMCGPRVGMIYMPREVNIVNVHE